MESKLEIVKAILVGYCKIIRRRGGKSFASLVKQRVTVRQLVNIGYSIQSANDLLSKLYKDILNRTDLNFTDLVELSFESEQCFLVEPYSPTEELKSAILTLVLNELELNHHHLFYDQVTMVNIGSLMLHGSNFEPMISISTTRNSDSGHSDKKVYSTNNFGQPPKVITKEAKSIKIQESKVLQYVHENCSPIDRSQFEGMNKKMVESRSAMSMFLMQKDIAEPFGFGGSDIYELYSTTTTSISAPSLSDVVLNVQAISFVFDSEYIVSLIKKALFAYQQIQLHIESYEVRSSHNSIQKTSSEDVLSPQMESSFNQKFKSQLHHLSLIHI